MKKFFLNLQFIFKPNYWIMNEPYSKEVDLLMNDLLDKFEFTDITYYTAKLGETKIWIANQPYSCIIPSNYKLNDFSYRASRLTIQKGIKKLNGRRVSELPEAINEIRSANGLVF